MNSFTLTAIGKLSRDPESVTWGAKTFARFCLAGHDLDSSNGGEPSRESATKIWFTAYGPVGEVIFTKARKGDQLFVEAFAKTMMGSSSPYDHEFIVKGFVFGAHSGLPGCPTDRAGINAEFNLLLPDSSVMEPLAPGALVDYMTPATWHRGKPDEIPEERARQIAAARAHRQ